MKVGLDRAAAVLGLLLLLPVLLGAALAVRLSMGHPVFYVQARPGRDGRAFRLVKLRTMRDLRDPRGGLLPDGERITRLGRLLRASSIDELPQLWNILRGELSFVGPRPLLIEYLERYTHEQRRRHDVLPGITGWAQVNGRNLLSWEEKFTLDVWYADHWSLLLDLRILLLTVGQVLRRRGISQEGHATMPVFDGSNQEGNRREEGR